MPATIPTAAVPHRLTSPARLSRRGRHQRRNGTGKDGRRMATEERMEANANLALWCVHIIGPDDVYAEPSHASAVADADKLNQSLWSRPNTPDDVMCFAFADVWPWSAEEHAKALAAQHAQT